MNGNKFYYTVFHFLHGAINRFKKSLQQAMHIARRRGGNQSHYVLSEIMSRYNCTIHTCTSLYHTTHREKCEGGKSVVLKPLISTFLMIFWRTGKFEITHA